MLARAKVSLPDADLRVGDLEDPLPEGPFDLVVSAPRRAPPQGAGQGEPVHRVAAVLRPGGRLVLADLVVPDDPADVVSFRRRHRRRPKPDRPAGCVAARGGLRASHRLGASRPSRSSSPTVESPSEAWLRPLGALGALGERVIPAGPAGGDQPSRVAHGEPASEALEDGAHGLEQRSAPRGRQRPVVGVGEQPVEPLRGREAPRPGKTRAPRVGRSARRRAGRRTPRRPARRRARGPPRSRRARGRGAGRRPRARRGPPVRAHRSSRTARRGRRAAGASAMRAKPAWGSTQCQAWPAVTRSNRCPRRSHVSRWATSTARPRARAHGGHARVRLESGHAAAAGRRRAQPRCRSRTPTSSTSRGPLRHERIDEGGGVARPGAVVALRVGSERLGTDAIGVQHDGERRPGDDGATLRRLHHHLVDVAPQPVLAGLEGLHERVGVRGGVLGGVAVGATSRSSRRARRRGTAGGGPHCPPMRRQSSQPSVVEGVTSGVDLVEMRAGSHVRNADGPVKSGRAAPRRASGRGGP